MRAKMYVANKFYVWLVEQRLLRTDNKIAKYCLSSIKYVLDRPY